MSGSSDSSSKRILVFFPGALGDFLCFLPALRHLAKVGNVDLLAYSEIGCLLPSQIRVDSLHRAEVARLFVPGAWRTVEVGDTFAHYDDVYSWLGSSQKDFVDNLMGIFPDRVKLFPFRPKEFSGPMADYYLSCLGAAGAAGSGPSVTIGREAILWAEKFWRVKGLSGKAVLSLGPGSGAREKNWQPEYFKRVAAWWRDRWGGEALVFLGPAEEEMDERTLDSWNGAPCVRNERLDRVASLLSKCELYLGNDSGLTHLAANVGVRTIALFGPSNPIHWSPRGRDVSVLSRRVECSPCVPGEMKRCPHRKCLRELSPEMVIGAIEDGRGRDASVETAHGELLA